MRVEVKLTGMEGVLETLKSLPPEIVSKKGGPVRAALAKGALVILKQAKANFRAAVALPGKSGITITTGFTEKNIVMRRKQPFPGVNGERYVITVAGKKHPNENLLRRKSRSTGKRHRAGPQARPVQANDIAFMMEYGTSKQAATPWLRPAFNAKAHEAITTVESELVKRIDAIVKRLAAQNQGR
jgi:hypothetical protein